MMIVMVVLFAFRILGAAMLTQPPVTEIEEMGGLVHRRSEISKSEIAKG